MVSLYEVMEGNLRRNRKRRNSKFGVWVKQLLHTSPRVTSQVTAHMTRSLKKKHSGLKQHWTNGRPVWPRAAQRVQMKTSSGRTPERPTPAARFFARRLLFPPGLLRAPPSGRKQGGSRERGRESGGTKLTVPQKGYAKRGSNHQITHKSRESHF